MKILVGDLAQLYGVSSQTLHYYEEKGILNPKRDTINGYRYFDNQDLSRLGTIKKSRNAQISLVSTIDGLNEVDESSIVKRYQEQKQLLLDEVDLKLRIIRQLDEDMNLYLKYKMSGEAPVLEHMGEMWIFNSDDGDLISKSKKDRIEAIPWFKNILHTFASEKLYINKDYECEKYIFGMLTTKENAHWLKIEKTKNVSIIKAGKSVTMIIDTLHKQGFNGSLKKCCEFIEKNNLTLRETPYTRMIFLYKDEENETHHIKQLIFPVK